MNKAKINLIGMCFLCSVACIFFGCNDDHSLEGPKVQGSASAVSTVDSSAAPAIFFATDLEAGSVQVLSATLDSVDAGVTIQMNVDYGDGVLARRLLMIKSAYDQSGNPRFDAKISDTLGDLLWQFSLGGDLAEPSHTWLTEKSGTDSITIEDRLTGESFSETYYQNGTQQRFGFPTSDVGHIAQR
ncbi:MAG TPA: hypothetical protein VJ983_09790, partial [candidate division Zixibacteria bacterium]|nr:hypothetical protein [candidate division Zixibacteria bacterium]